MPAELFRSTLPPTPVRRRASLLPVSIATHVAVIAAVVLGPLVAPGELPEPNRPLLYAVTAIELPDPPPAPAPRAAASATPRRSSPDRAPLDAPAVIAPESAIEPVAFGSDIDLGGMPGLGSGVTGGMDLPDAREAPPPSPPRHSAPHRVGGQIQPPRALRSVPPVYPPIAQQARVEGAVRIDAVIGVDGRVREATVVDGSPLLSGAALDAVRQWTFTPTRLNGQPVAVVMTVTVVFSLR